MATDSQLILPEEFVIDHVQEWKLKLSDFLKQDPPLLLKAAEVSRVDTAAIQLLAAFVIEARRQEVEFFWVEPSESLKAIAQSIGMTNYLAFP